MGGGTGGGAEGLSTDVAVLSVGKPLSCGRRLRIDPELTGLGASASSAAGVNVMLGGKPGSLGTSASFIAVFGGSSRVGKGGDGS